MKRISVHTSKDYEVLVGRGLLSQVGTYIKEVLNLRRLCLVTDDTVEKLYADQVRNSLEEAGFSVCTFVFPAGESSKNGDTYFSILEFLAEQKLTRSDSIIALGGGVTGDMAGFAAATYLRGISFVQIPTTLLAAVDSSVGGKTGINSKSGKNLFGAFWQPSLVICDCDTFETLPRETYLDGIAEAVKCGVIEDQYLFSHISALSNEEIVCRCLAVKSRIVEADEREQGLRQLLNFGHTVGHAIEKCSGYKTSHGHAVAIGMIIVTKAAYAFKIVSEDFSLLISKVLLEFGFDINCPYTGEELAEAASIDKKRSGDNVTFIIAEALGRCIPVNIDVTDLQAFIESGL